MTHPPKKKLSLSERFGTIGPLADYRNKAQKNSEMVSKLQLQITEVVRKRSEGYDRESQAKMISKEISDVQQRFDDAPVACQKFTPFKVELRVNIDKKHAEPQKGSKMNEKAYYNENLDTPFKSQPNKTSPSKGNESIASHVSVLEHHTQNDSVSNGTAAIMAVTENESKMKINLQKSLIPCTKTEKDVNIQPLPELNQDALSSETHQPCDVKVNSNNAWLQGNSTHHSPQNAAVNLISVEEQQKQNQNRTQCIRKTPQLGKDCCDVGNYTEPKNMTKEPFNKAISAKPMLSFNNGYGGMNMANPNSMRIPQSGKESCNEGNYTEPKNMAKEPFNKAIGAKPMPSFNNGYVGMNIASPNSMRRQGSNTSPNYSKGKYAKKTSPIFKHGKGSSTCPNFNKGKDSNYKSIKKYNKGEKSKTSPNFNQGKGFKAGPNFDKGKGSKTSPNLNQGKGFKAGPNFNKGKGSKTSPNFNQGKGFNSGPNFDKGKGSKTSPNFNKGKGYNSTASFNNDKSNNTSPIFNSEKRSNTSPKFDQGLFLQSRQNVRERQDCKTSLFYSWKPDSQTAPNFIKGQDFKTSPNYSHIHSIETNTNVSICSESSPNLNKGQGFQTSLNFDKKTGFQTSPNFKQNTLNSIGCNTFGLSNQLPGGTNFRQYYGANTFSSDDPCTVYDTRDKFYNYQRGNQFSKGQQQRDNFHNEPGFGGQPINQQSSFSSIPANQSIVNKARPSNQDKISQPFVHSPSKQFDITGGFGKRHASPVASNQYMAPTKKRMLTTDPLYKDVPSVQNRLPYVQDKLPNTPIQENPCGAVSHGKVYNGNGNFPYGYYPGHVANTSFQTPVMSNYGLALHGPFTPKTRNASSQNCSLTLDSTDSKCYHLNDPQDLSRTKQYLFNKMFDKSDAGDGTKITEDTGIPGMNMKPTGDVVKPTGFYKEILKESRETSQNEKEETELVSTLLTQCQAMAQKDDDKQALHTIFNIIHQEMGHQSFLPPSEKNKISSTAHVPSQTRSTSEVSWGSDEPKFSPASSSPDAASRQNGNNRFEGRTLLKGGVKPRHIPKTLINKQDDDPPKDPRSVKDLKTKSALARKMKDLPLPPFFIEFVATKKYDKKKSIETKVNEMSRQNTESVSEVNLANPSTGFETKDTKIGMGNIDGLNPGSNTSVQYQQTANEKPIVETKTDDCGLDPVEMGKSDSISPILPRITVRLEKDGIVTDNNLNTEQSDNICSRDPRLRATSISKKREDKAIVDLPVLKYEEYTVEKRKSSDTVCKKVVKDSEPIQFQDYKGCTGMKGNKDCLQSQHKNSPLSCGGTNGRETNIARSAFERNLHHSDSKNPKEEFSRKLTTQQHRYSMTGNSPPKRYSRFSSERSLSRSRSSSRSRDEEWTGKEVSVRRTNRIDYSCANIYLSHSYKRDTVVYNCDKQCESYENQFLERNEHDRWNRERHSMSPGTCRYLKRRDLERKSSPPSSGNRNVSRNRYQGRRNRNYSEGSDYPELCFSPLR
ncbi:uncharacterized protein LOC132551653 [Ylistrum balloti]|uniref:uncharacterized protein LOC132551653 n=1 Tax=Ylistrum balloti TaxID=509963 RepID=UPI002905A4F5|nr:uncharacterized protein LOC132551653 [Ylistrum balloti]